jgi:glycosyltransferase involved in cell wall biosynthesis
MISVLQKPNGLQGIAAVMKKRVLLISYHFYPDRAVGAKRPTKLAESLHNEGWLVDTITRKLSPPEEALRHSAKSFGQIYSLYQPPSILDPLWRKIKGSRKQPAGKKRSTDSPPHESDPGTTKSAEVSETLFAKVKRYLFSLQALLDANKAWLTLSFLYLFYLRLRGRKYDLIISSSPPASAHLVGIVAKKLFGSKWIVDLRDPLNFWHEVSSDCSSLMRERLETWLEKLYYRYSDGLVVTTDPLKNRIIDDFLKIKPKVHLIYNGFDGKPIKDKAKINDEVRIVFAGSIYMNRNPFPLFKSIKVLSENTKNNFLNIRLDLYGDCENWNGIDLNQWIIKNNLIDKIKIHSFVGPEILEKILSDAHILVNFAQNQILQIPAKTFEYLKYPAISLAITENESAVSKLMSDYDLGVSVENNEEDLLQGIKSAIEKFNANDVRSNHIVDFSRDNQNSKYIALAEKLTSSHREEARGG